ncbi:MAG: 2TM domain-containing protein [Sandaracinaceae bacterium]|nr:2TM domain-containing protein [Sandaracinaceae bacterium]
MDRQYSDEEVEAIFRRALEQQVDDEDGYAHDELVAAAREVGLSDAQIAKAVGEIDAQRGHAAVYERVKKRQRERWLRHFVTYLVVVGGLLGLHALGLFGVAAIWTAVFWGMGLALHTFSTVRGPSEEAVEKERRKLNRKARRAAAAKARVEARRRKEAERAERKARGGSQAGDELERVVEEGVSLLLKIAAEKIREASQPKPAPPARPPTAFDEFVADKKAGRDTTARRDPVVTPPPTREPLRARVEVADEEEAPEVDGREARRRSRRR